MHEAERHANGGIVTVDKASDSRVLPARTKVEGEDGGPDEFRTLIESLRQGVIGLDPSGFITFVNPFMARMLGYEAREMVGMHLFSIVDEGHVEACAEALDDTREGPETRLELALLHREGRKMVASVDLSPLSGDRKGCVASVTDLTHQKWMEESLRTGEETVRALLDANTESHLLLDREGTILLANESVARRLQTATEELIGTCLFDQVPAEVGKWRRAYFDNVLLTGEPVHFQDMRGGRWYDHYYYPVKDARGDVHRVAVYSMDISDRRVAETALRESEERYRTAVESSNDGVKILQKDRYVYLNRKMVEMCGYESADEIIGQPIGLLIYPDDRPQLLDMNQRRALGEEVPSRYEVRHMRKDGTPFPVELSVANISYQGEPALLVYARDITERKEAEEALRRSEENYRSIFENATEGIYQTTPEGRFLTANPAAARLFGYDSPEELIATVTDIGAQLYVYPEDRSKTVELLETRGFFENLEVLCRKKDGSLIWVLATCHAVRDDQDNIVCIEGMSKDITDRKKAEEALLKSEAKYRTIVENSNDAVYIHDFEGTIIDVNENACRMVGYGRDELIGAKLAKIDKAWYLPQNPELEQLARSGRTLFERENIRKDGSVVPVEISVAVISREGKGIIHGFVRDVSERKRAERALFESEARYRRIVDTAVEGIWVMDENYVATFTNERMASMLGYRPEEVLGRHIDDFLFPEDLSAHEAQARERRKGLTGRYERRLRRKDGSALWAIVSATPVMDDEGVFRGAFSMITDITERKRMEEALRFTQFAIDRAGDGVFIADGDARIVYVNERACQTLGYTREELLTMDVPSVDPNYPMNRWRIRWDETKKRGSGTFESVHRRKDGTVFPMEISSSILSTEKAEYVCAIVRDISDRKAAESEIRRLQQEWESIFQGMGHPAAVLDGECRVMAVNRATEHALRRPAIELTGKHCYEIFHGTTSRPPDCPFVRSLESKQTETVETDFEILGRTYLVSHTPVLDPQGTASRIIHIATDITERKKTEEALHGATKRLKSLSGRLLEVKEKEATRLARELHDEIGQALTAMKINMQAAERSNKPGFVTSMVQENVKIVDRVLQQVRHLSVELHPTILDDLGLVAALRWYTDWLSQRAGFEGEVVIDGPLRKLPADIELACFRIAQEGLTNVVRHAHAGHVSVTLGQSGSGLLLSVKDDGKGFDTMEARTRALKGQSLGLISMEERALLAGGELEVFSGPGEGTEILVRFPLPGNRLEGGATKRVHQ